MARFWRAVGRALARAAAGRRRLARLGLPRRVAGERARELLLACLDREQRAEYERSHSFRVRGASGQCYRIAFGTTANIEVLGERGELQCRLCAGPTEVPTPAVMLAQKLMLETREAEFLRIAARHPVVVSGERMRGADARFRRDDLSVA